MSYDTSPQTARNLALAFDLMHGAIEDDEIFDSIPDGGSIILLPHDDDRLVLQNLALAARSASRGETVHVMIEGVQTSAAGDDDRQTWTAFRWAAVPPREPALTIHSDFITGSAVFDFSAGTRSTRRLPVTQTIGLLVDPDRQEAVGFLVPEAYVSHLFRQVAPDNGASKAETFTSSPSLSADLPDLTEDLALAAA